MPCSSVASPAAKSPIFIVVSGLFSCGRQINFLVARWTWCRKSIFLRAGTSVRTFRSQTGFLRQYSSAPREFRLGTQSLKYGFGYTDMASSDALPTGRSAIRPPHISAAATLRTRQPPPHWTDSGCGYSLASVFAGIAPPAASREFPEGVRAFPDRKEKHRLLQIQVLNSWFSRACYMHTASVGEAPPDNLRDHRERRRRQTLCNRARPA